MLITHPLRRAHRTTGPLLIAFTLCLTATGCGSDSKSSATNASGTTLPNLTAVTASGATLPTTALSAGLPVISDQDPRYAFNILTGAGGGVLLTRLDGTDIVQLGTDVPGVHKRDDFSPDGQHIVFVDETTETMWIANLDGSPTVQVPGCDHNGCDNPAFSPDGTHLAYSRVESAPDITGPAAVGIEVVDLATGEITQVVRLERPHLADVPRWSADGTQLVIGVDEMDDEANETGASIAIVPADGSAATEEPQYLTDFSLYAYTPDWSWVTGEIVMSNSIKEFSAGFDAATEACDVWVIGPDGSGLRQVTHVAAGEQIKGAKWTPDGTEILAFSTNVGAVRIDPATGAMTPVPHPDSTGSPRQRP
jgi:Tol biopolymer transport system component